MRTLAALMLTLLPHLAFADADSDGFDAPADCNDNDPSLHPGAPELCDDIDNDCNSVIDDLEVRWYADRDGDTFGSASERVDACPTDVLPSLGSAGVWVAVGGDCDDTNSAIGPGIPEFCDGVDNDCNGAIDDGIPTDTIWYVDQDHDGFGRVSFSGAVQGACPPDVDYTSWSPFNTDCKDTDPTIHPLITTEDWAHPPLRNLPAESSEVDRDPSFVGDGIDEDCDGVDLCYVDADDDKFGAPGVGGAPPAVVADNNLSCRDRSLAYTADNALDCDDADATVGPGAPEITGDGIDQDCDGVDAIASADTDAPGDTDVFTMAGQDTDGGDDTDSGTTKPAGCGCDSSSGAPLWLALGLPWLARRRRAAA